MLRRLLYTWIKKPSTRDAHNSLRTHSRTILIPRTTLSDLRPLARVKKNILSHLFGRIYSETDLKSSKAITEFALVSPALNEALEMSGKASQPRERSRSPATRDDEELNNGSSESIVRVSSPDIETLGEPECLEELRLAYDIARQNSSNSWLHFAKSCYIFIYRGGGEPNRRMAAFDLDGTLIRPKSNKRIPRSATDWELFSVWTKVKLQQILNAKDKLRFVIFTNQNGVGMNIVPLEEIQERIELVMKKIDIPGIVFVSTEKDEFRKPRTGMFQLYNKCFNGSETLLMEDSFYCGDAVGYPSHSDADIKFASKLGLPFLPPEKFVRGVKPKLVDSV